MNCVLLTGAPGPTLTSLASLLRSSGCRVLLAAAPGAHAHFIKLTLAVTEFRPQDTRLDAFADRLRALAPLRTVVVGPDLSEQHVASLLALDHVGSYLRLSAPTAEKRRALRAWLPEPAREVLSLGQLRLNPQDQSVRYGTHRLDLTPSEFRLLQVLMQRPGQPADCTELAELAACQHVPTHLLRVRRKLAAYSAVPLLRGHPGRSYVLDARRSPRTPRDPALALKLHLHHLF